MNYEQFCYWLKGALENDGSPGEQCITRMVKRRLAETLNENVDRESYFPQDNKPSPGDPLK